MSELSNAESDEPRRRRVDLSTERDEGLAAAQDALANGDLVVIPTDTVYGIAADALQPAAVQGLLDAKHRGRDMPPPLLIAEPAMLRALVIDVPVEVDALINRFWPGALTLIMRAQPTLRMDLGKTEGTIAVRVPDHPDARALLRQTGPLAVSSANVSGQPPATTTVVTGAVPSSVGVFATRTSILPVLLLKYDSTVLPSTCFMLISPIRSPHNGVGGLPQPALADQPCQAARSVNACGVAR